MNRKIILFPLAMAAILGLASCTSENPQPSNSEPETSQVPSSNEEVKKATITTNKTAIELTVGDTERITVTVENAENKNVSFASSDVTIATVDAAAGVVTAIKEGTTKITVTLDADPTVKAEVAVTVKAPELIKLSSVTGPVSEKNTYYGVITAKTSKGFVIDDGTGALYVCKTTNYNVGDYVSVTDSISAYYGLLETSFSPTIAKMEGIAPTLREATPLTKEIIDTVQAQVTDAQQSGGKTGFHLADMGPYSFKLPAVIEESYTNFMLGDYKLSPMAYSGDKIVGGVEYTVKGYFAGWNSKGFYYQFIVSSIDGTYDPTTSVSISAANGATSVSVGMSLQMSASALPATARQSFNWSTNDSTIATIDEKGLLTGVSAGSVVVTASSKDNAEVKAEMTISVTESASLPIEGIFDTKGSLPKGWESKADFYTNGSLKFNKLSSDYSKLASPKFAAVNKVVASLSLASINDNTRTDASWDETKVFTVRGLDANGTQVAIGYISNAAITGTNVYASATLEGEGICQIEFSYTNWYKNSSSGAFANVGIGKAKVSAE